LRFDTGGRVKSVVARSTRSSKVEEFPVERIVLAAGTLSSSRIVLDSVYRDAGQVLELPGLMDNRQILMPFINLGMIGRPFNPSTYQYHQLAIGLEEAAPKDYVHALITTLKTALIHPIVQTVPFDLRTSLSVFRNLHAALGLVNINFPDTRRPENRLSLDVSRGRDETSLVIRYAPPREERGRIAGAERRIKRALFALGCVAPPGMTHMRPMGASVHYAGALPMSKAPAPLTTSPVCQSHDFPNLFIVDGTTFPFLPAKNLTLTLMANAARVAAEAF
jgi:choline dehydrogenase-like flavoprotein